MTSELTEETINDDAMVEPLLNLVKTRLKRFKADRAYDSEKVYQDILKFSRNRKIKIAIPPRPNGKKACLFKVFLNKREQCNREWFYLGPYQWQKKSGYNKRGLVETRAVINTPS